MYLTKFILLILTLFSSQVFSENLGHFYPNENFYKGNTKDIEPELLNKITYDCICKKLESVHKKVFGGSNINSQFQNSVAVSSEQIRSYYLNPGTSNSIDTTKFDEIVTVGLVNGPYSSNISKNGETVYINGNGHFHFQKDFGFFIADVSKIYEFKRNSRLSYKPDGISISGDILIPSFVYKKSQNGMALDPQIYTYNLNGWHLQTYIKNYPHDYSRKAVDSDYKSVYFSNKQYFDCLKVGLDSFILTKK